VLDRSGVTCLPTVCALGKRLPSTHGSLPDLCDFQVRRLA
jgi:hypothetical protein